jgi:hypothetical protein
MPLNCSSTEIKLTRNGSPRLGGLKQGRVDRFSCRVLANFADGQRPTSPKVYLSDSVSRAVGSVAALKGVEF